MIINKAKANVDELKTTLDAVLRESPNSSSTSYVKERYSNLLSRLEKFEQEIESLYDDGLLSQSSTRIRDNVSVITHTTHTTARCPTSRRCSPSMNEIPEASNPERSSFSNKTQHLPQRPEKLSLHFSDCHMTKPMLSKFSNGTNKNPLTIGKNAASFFRPINNDNTIEYKTEAKHSDKKNLQNLRRTSQKLPTVLLTVIQRYLLLIISQTITSSLKQTMIESSRFVL